jgi:hypothetical protein
MKTYAFNQLSSPALAEIVQIHREPIQPGVWDELARRELGERERSAIELITGKLFYFRAHLANEATVWARAIYPLLVLAEREGILAFSGVPLYASFDDVELRGEADGALAASVDEEPAAPYLVVIEAKRGVTATDPMPQLLGAMLCAARLNERSGRPAEEIFGCYTIADIWTFVRCRLDWSKPKPVMSVLTSREYAEKTEAAKILAILESIVGKYPV